ncbi:MAG TPA: hypothetical protein VHO47_04665 [Candidatus Babeliales bacterium]|nr:hypothetical protein [Candidatus Babeliales bacterium]
MKKLFLFLVLTLEWTSGIKAMSTSGNQSQVNSLDEWLGRLAKLPQEQKMQITQKLNKLPTVPEIRQKAPLLIEEAERKASS